MILSEKVGSARRNFAKIKPLDFELVFRKTFSISTKVYA